MPDTRFLYEAERKLICRSGGAASRSACQQICCLALRKKHLIFGAWRRRHAIQSEWLSCGSPNFPSASLCLLACPFPDVPTEASGGDSNKSLLRAMLLLSTKHRETRCGLEPNTQCPGEVNCLGQSLYWPPRFFNWLSPHLVNLLVSANRESEDIDFHLLLSINNMGAHISRFHLFHVVKLVLCSLFVPLCIRKRGWRPLAGPKS